MLKKKRTFLLIVIIVCAILFFLWLFLRPEKKASPAIPLAPAVSQKDTAHVYKTPLAQVVVPKSTGKGRHKQITEGITTSKPDTSVRPETSTVTATPPEPENTSIVRLTGGICDNDTVTPWVYTDPAGGLHRKAISVKLFATKTCTIRWKTDSTAEWNVYKGEEIPVAATTTLFLTAFDSCGNRMQERGEYYEIQPEETVKYCPEGMEHIKIGETSFCMDRYEWPDTKGVVPKSYVSLYQAMDTCAGVGKRLCTADEWTIACTGPYGWKYPYGSSYELYACVTNDTTARKSGSKTECRGYFDVYDMSGNLAEWTSTRSSKNRQFYNVMGGFWESGKQSGCFDVRYSYFPQNRHNPVGFRCCLDAKQR
jgi:Uncharacterized conserved protein